MSAFSRSHRTDLDLIAKLEAAKDHVMTPEEIAAQRQSWVRGMTARCEHGIIDFEQCPDCRSAARKRLAEGGS